MSEWDERVWEDFRDDVMRMSSNCADEAASLVPDGSVSDSIVEAVRANEELDERGFSGSIPEVERLVEKALDTFRDLEALGLVTYCTSPDAPAYKPDQGVASAPVQLAFFANIPDVAFSVRSIAEVDRAMVDRRKLSRPPCDWQLTGNCAPGEWLYTLALARGQYLPIFSVCGACVEYTRKAAGAEKLPTGWLTAVDGDDWLAGWRKYHWTHDQNAD